MEDKFKKEMENNEGLGIRLAQVESLNDDILKCLDELGKKARPKKSKQMEKPRKINLFVAFVEQAL